MSAEDAEDEFGAGGGDEFDDAFGLDDDDTGGSTTGDSAEDAEDEFGAGGGDEFDDAFGLDDDDTGGSTTGDSAEDAEDSFGAGGDAEDAEDSFGAPSGSTGADEPTRTDSAEDAQDEFASQETTTPNPDGEPAPSEVDSTEGGEPVPDVDGRKTRLSGPEAPGNTRDTTTATVLDEAGDEGERVFPEDDDPLVPDDGRGIEDRGARGVGGVEVLESQAETPAERARADALERLQGRVDREVPGVDAIDTDAYNIVEARGGGFRVELTDQGVEQVREATAAEADQEQRDRSRVRTAEEVGDVPVDPAVRDRPGSAEGAADAFASGGLTAPVPAGQQGSAEAASDLVGSGTVAPAGEFVSFPFANTRLRRAAARGRNAARSTPSSGSETRDRRGSGGGIPVLGVPLAAARGIDQAFGPDRAPDQRTADPGAAAVQDAVPLPDQREVAADFRAITGLPSERELTSDLNTGAEDAVGVRPRETVETERQRARDATLTTAAQAAERAQERPLAALAAGAPVAAAEPSPLGEAALLGGAAAGVIGVDLAGRIRERRSEIEQPERAPSDSVAEIEEPQRAPSDATTGELGTPSDAPSTTRSELEAGGEFDVAELDVPETDQRDPLVLRTQQLRGRQRARQRQRERQREDTSVPVNPVDEIPREEEDTSVPVVPVNDIDRGRRVYRDPDRPEQGVRTFRDTETAEETEQPPQEVEEVAPGTVTGVEAGAGVLFPAATTERSGTLADVRPDAATTPILAREQQLESPQDQALQLDNRLRQRQRAQQRQQQRRVERQRTQQRQQQLQRQQFQYPAVEAVEAAGVGVGTPTATGRGRLRRPDVAPPGRDPGFEPARDLGEPGARPADLPPNPIGELIAAFGGVGQEGRRGGREPTAADFAAGSVPVAANLEGDDEFEAAAGFFGAGVSAPSGSGAEPSGDAFALTFDDDDEEGFL